MGPQDGGINGELRQMIEQIIDVLCVLFRYGLRKLADWYFDLQNSHPESKR